MELIGKIKKYGLGKSLLLLSKKVFNIEIMKLHYLKLTIDESKLEKSLIGFDLPVKELEMKDFLLGDPIVFNSSKLELIKRRLESDDYRAFGIIENDKLIYSTWISLKEIGLPLISKRFALRSNEGLLEDSYCDVIARGRGLHSKMNNYRIRELYKLSKGHVIAIVLDGNEAAFRVQYKSGFVNLGSFYCGKIFGFEFCQLNKDKYDCN